MEKFIIFGLCYLFLITVLLWVYCLALFFKVQDFWRDPDQDQDTLSPTPSDLSRSNVMMADRPNILIVSERVRRHQPDTEKGGEQKRLKGSTSNQNITHSSVIQGQMVPVSSMSNWDRVICGETAKRKRPDDVTEVGNLWHLEADGKVTFNTPTPSNQLRSKKKPRTNRPEQGIHNHLAQIKRKQATWYPMGGTQQFELGQNLATETAAGMAQLRLACETDSRPMSTLYDRHEQIVPVVSSSGNTSQGSRWLDKKHSMVSCQPWQNYAGVTTTPYKTTVAGHTGPATSHRPLCAEMIGTACRGRNEAMKRAEMFQSPFSLFGQELGSLREAAEAPWDSTSQEEFRWKPQNLSRLPSMPASNPPRAGPPTRCHDNRLGTIDTLAAVVPSVGTNSPTRKSMFGCDSNRGPALKLPTIYELELRSKVSKGVVMCSKTTSIWGAWDNGAWSSLVQSCPPPASQFAVDEE